MDVVIYEALYHISPPSEILCIFLQLLPVASSGFSLGLSSCPSHPFICASLSGKGLTNFAKSIGQIIYFHMQYLSQIITLIESEHVSERAQ